jgi:hypothetical protein
MNRPLCMGQVIVINNKALKNNRFQGFLRVYTEGGAFKQHQAT